MVGRVNSPGKTTKPRSRPASQAVKMEHEKVKSKEQAAHGRDSAAHKKNGGSRMIVDRATLFIQQAASTLEKELEAGINAAHSLEKRLIDVNAIRNQPQTEVLPRLRRDFHDTLDMVMDLLAMSVRGIEGIAQRSLSVTQAFDKRGEKETAAAAVMTLRPAAACHPGSVAEIHMGLENASDAPQEIVGFEISELVGPSGARIAGHHVTVEPLPAVVEPHGKARITIRVAIPADAKPGSYSGVLIASRLDKVRAMLALDVD